MRTKLQRRYEYYGVDAWKRASVSTYRMDVLDIFCLLARRLGVFGDTI